ncbi:hypothetical protein U7230_12805 [Carboxydochorda subterranea]|uniref:Uncharacterized protein n=1 Tax=Carboxydichorda subterranea TaxID=3109565 RepID=A0ABZ1BWI9_9FIRM|nr:hypothetical protein [Limnochorda sp. L945t]WRP16953.1 hypothetical protein U7230_12805 [Limnochorda sp. L945t]
MRVVLLRTVVVALLAALAWTARPAMPGGGSVRASSAAPQRGEASGTVSAFPPPLPYVQGGSRWLYRSNFGEVRVRLEGGDVQAGRRCYRWEIRLLGVGMREELGLTAAGLFTASREFLLPLGAVSTMVFTPPELTIPLPLEVGRHWESTTSASSGPHAGPAQVAGTVEAYASVAVAAGRFEAYRIRLERRDAWGGSMDATIWLDPEAGVVKAVGQLRWPGLVGSVQRALGLHRLELELVRAEVRGPVNARPGELP